MTASIFRADCTLIDAVCNSVTVRVLETLVNLAVTIVIQAVTNLFRRFHAATNRLEAQRTANKLPCATERTDTTRFPEVGEILVYLTITVVIDVVAQLRIGCITLT
jgi:hypothetical protein